LLLFNWFGYHMLNAYMENRATLQLQINLDDRQYDESELISVKVPARHLSYYNNSEQFERIDGQIEISGLQYSYVKCRLYNDSIEMLCIPNHGAIHFKKASFDYFKLVNDLQRPGQGSKNGSHSFKRFPIIYCLVTDLFSVGNPFYKIKDGSFNFDIFLPANFSYIDERPPKKSA
jgi:hypothetical protein